jgi:hypothetical protein
MHSQKYKKKGDKIMKQVVFTRGSLSVVQGIVKEVIGGTGKAEGKLTTVKIESDVYDKTKGTYSKTTPIAFWNYEDPATGRVTKNATNAQDYLAEGDFVSMMVSEKDGHYTGIAFKKNNALWKFPADPADPKVKEYNIFVGTLSHGITVETGTPKYITSMRIDVGRGETENFAITFWNDTGKQPKLAENARKCLSPYKATDGIVTYKRAAVVCSAINTYLDSNGDEKKGTKAYSFDRS